MPADSSVRFTIFFAVWVVLAASFAAFDYFSRDTNLKRKLLPVQAIGVGVLFLAFGLWTGKLPMALWPVAVPMVAFIAFLNIKGTRFYNSCGKRYYVRPGVKAAEHCRKCGAPFT